MEQVSEKVREQVNGCCALKYQLDSVFPPFLRVLNSPMEKCGDGDLLPTLRMAAVTPDRFSIVCELWGTASFVCGKT